MISPIKKLLLIITIIYQLPSLEATAWSRTFLQRKLPQSNKTYSQNEMKTILQSMAPKIDNPKARAIKQPPDAGKVKSGFSTAKQIVGGSFAALGQFPWHAIVNIDSKYLCGGSLILEDWVLTACHCTEDSINFEVVLGSLGRFFDSPGTVKQTTTEKYEHPNYDPNTIINDIALLKLPEKVTLSETIKLLALPQISDAKTTFVGIPATICGFGMTTETSEASERLNYFVDNIVSNAKCVVPYGHESVRSSSICAKTSKQSICQGDSGGALIYRDYTKTWRQIGIVSFNSAAGCLKGYSVYTRVTSYLGWLSETIQEDVIGTTNGEIPTPATTTQKPPTCSIQSFNTMGKCCIVSNPFEILQPKFGTTCKGGRTVFKIFNAYILNKYQSRPTNAIDLSSNTKMTRELARGACYVNCYLKENGAMDDDGLIDEASFSGLLHTPQANSGGTWDAIVATAMSDCYKSIHEISDLPNFVSGNANNCDGKALLILQCVIFKTLDNCPDAMQDTKCARKFSAMKACGESISFFQSIQ